MAEVQFLCKRTVVSTKAVEPRKFSTLSPLDRIMERNYLRLVFYYSLPTGRDPGEVTKKLRESISEMLSAYPIATGRLLRTQDDHWMIKCNDAGVRMIEARVNGTVEEWLKNVDREKEIKLVYWEEMYYKPYFWSTFYVQITEFEEGGLAIGFSCTHMLSDAINATMMIRAWAETTLRGESSSPPLFLPLPCRKEEDKITNNQPCVNLINVYKSAMERSEPISDRKQATISIHFNQEMVKSCMIMAGSHNSHDHEPSITPFEAISALLWTCISKVKGTETSLVDMCVCMDTRKVLGLDKSFFGNCMVYKRVQGNGLDNLEVSKAAALIKETVSRTGSDEVMELIEWLERQNCKDNLPMMNGSHLVCVNLDNVDSYSAVFEENASPLRVSYYFEPAVGPGQIVILPSPGGEESESRVVVVTLPEDEAEKVLEDDMIKQFAPIILMGLNKNDGK